MVWGSVPPSSFLTSDVWCLQNGAFWRRGAQQVWRRRWWWQWWRGCRRTRGAGPWWQQARWAPWSTADVQAVDGPESSDHGPVQPYTRPAELPNSQPLPLPLQRRQLCEEVRQKDYWMAISFRKKCQGTVVGVCLESMLRCGLAGVTCTCRMKVVGCVLTDGLKRAHVWIIFLCDCYSVCFESVQIDMWDNTWFHCLFPLCPSPWLWAHHIQFPGEWKRVMTVTVVTMTAKVTRTGMPLLIDELKLVSDSLLCICISMCAASWSKCWCQQYEGLSTKQPEGKGNDCILLWLSNYYWLYKIGQWLIRQWKKTENPPLWLHASMMPLENTS